jgi:predicted dehydrogenase
MTQRIKIAILGGSIKSAVGRAHVAALRVTGKYEIVAGFMSRNPVVNEESANEYGIDSENLFNNLEDIARYCKKERIVILVLTPTDQHISQVTYLLGEGIPVICEKALSNKLVEMEELQESIEKKKQFLAVIYNYNGYLAVRQIRKYCTEGRIGRILSVNAQMPQEGFIKKDHDGHPIQPQAWRLIDGEIPTISLDLGVHLHSIVKFTTGLSAKKVVGTQESKGNFSGLIDDVRALAKYDNNVDVTYWFSKSALGYRNGLEITIFGELGSLSWEQTNPEIIRYSDSKGLVTIIDRGFPDADELNSLIYNFFKAGHPTGFVEALGNYYTDVAAELHYFFSAGEIRSSNIYGIKEAIEGFRFLKAINNSSSTQTWQDI